MNDTHASRRPDSRSPRRRGSASTQLGELRFSDWYDTPVFEPDEDELIEEMATTGHGPRRLMARARLARDARRANRRPQWDSAPAPAPAATPRKPAAPPAADPAPAVSRTAVGRAAALQSAPAESAPAESAPAELRAAPTEPTPPATKAPVAKVEPQVAQPAPAATKPPVAQPAPAATKPPVAQPAPAATKPPAAKTAPPVAKPPVAKPAAPEAEIDDWAASGPALTDESMQIDLERENPWRRRMNSFLDGWAEREVAVAARLDRSLEKVLNPSLPQFIASAAKRDGSR